MASARDSADIPANQPGGIRLELDHRVAYRFLRLAGGELKCLEGYSRAAFGLTISKWKVLSVIGFFGPLSAGDLASKTSLEADKISRVTESLVGLDLVKRSVDHRDRRKAIFTLTRRGRHVNSKIEEVRCRIEVKLLEALTQAEVSSLYTLLDKLDEKASDLFRDRTSWKQIGLS